VRVDAGQLSVFDSGMPLDASSVPAAAPSAPSALSAPALSIGGSAGSGSTGVSGGCPAHGGSSLVARFGRVVSTDVATLDDVEVAAVLSDVAGLQRFLQAREIDLNQRLRQLAAQRPGVDPAAINARATGRSAGGAGRALERAAQAAQAPELKASMDEGCLSGEHLDAFTTAVRSLEPRLQPVLRALEADLVARAVAQRATVEQFRGWLQREIRLIETDDGKQRLERQKRDTRCRVWTDPNTGMVKASLTLDPERGAVFVHQLNEQLHTRLTQPRPPECPTDPLDAIDWLRAHALIDLITSTAGPVGKPEVIIVIDQDTYEHGRHQHSRVDCGPGIDLPIDTIRTIATRARFIPVVVNRDGVVITQGDPVASYDQITQSLTRPVTLDHHRSRRHASTRQRRALRAMYRTCAIPGCTRHMSITEAHHIHHWEHGGNTDLTNLLPLCRHHHDRLHQEGWHLTLAPDRSLTIRARDGTPLMANGPPAHQWT
jgi:hypothetical protein